MWVREARTRLRRTRRGSLNVRPVLPNRQTPASMPTWVNSSRSSRSSRRTKKEYLKQLKDAQLEKRRDIRNQLGEKPSLGEAIQEAKDSVVEAKQQAKEQARKLADEAKENAKEGRKRD